MLAIPSVVLPSITHAQTQGSLSASMPSNGELSAATRKAWGFNLSDVSPDPRVRFGVLENGMRFAILPNPNVPGVSLRLHVGVGFLQEKADEIGYAHLLEHVAFRGSAINPGGREYDSLERRGVGRATGYNAHTHPQDTIYRFDLPRTDAQNLESALRIIEGIGGKLTIDPEALEVEKRVVLEELRTTDPAVRALLLEELGLFAPVTATAFRHLSSEKSSIRSVNAERLRSFYERWYRPERTTLIVVGDIDSATIEARIRSSFAGWRSTTTPPPSLPVTIAKADRVSRYHVVRQTGVPTRVIIGVLSGRPEADTAATRKEHFLEHLGQEMLSRRLARRSQQGDAPISSGRAASHDYHQLGRIARLEVEARDKGWREALQATERELRSAVAKGFTDSEFEEQLAIARQALTERVRSETNASLADALVRAAAEGVIPTTQSTAASTNEYLASIRLDEVNKAFRNAWTSANPLVLVAHSEGDLTDQDVRKAWADSRRSNAEVLTSNAPTTFAYGSFGSPGSVVEDRRLQELNVRAVRFANNVRLNILPTGHELGRIRVTVRVGGGLLDLPQEPEGLATFMSTVFTAAGTGRHSAAELEAIFAGRAVKGGLSVSGDAFDASRITNDADLRAQLAVLAAYVVDPGYRTDVEERWPRAAESFLPTLGASSEGVMTRDVPRLLASGDRRFGIGQIDQMRRLDFAALRAAVSDSLDNGPIEIGIVGDIDEAQAITDVAATFGALPTRQLVARAGRRKVQFARIRKPLTITHKGRADDGRVGIYWPTMASEDPAREAEIELVAEVLRLSLIDTLRESMGITYAPTVSWTRSLGVPGYQHIAIVVPAAPEMTDKAFRAVDRVVDRLKREPVDIGLLERARNPLLERLVQASQSDEQLVDLVARAQTNPAALSALLTRANAVRAISIAQLNEAFGRILDANTAVRVRIVPSSR